MGVLSIEQWGTHAMVHEIPGRETAEVDRQRIELLLDGVKDYAILLLDTEGRVLNWNDGATLLFGYHAADVIGQPFSRFFIPEDRESGRPEAEVRQAAASGQVTCEEWQVRRDGTRFWGCVVITALRDERGELKGFAKVIRDATDRKQLEMELRRQAEELAEANRRKDEFLAMLSHELRNPLAPVLNSVHVLRQAPHDPSVVQFAGNMVERQVRHMARLIDDLLDVTRLTHGKVRLRLERIELGALAERAAESVRPLMQERGHRFTLVPHPGPIWLEADPVRLDQVLVNLLNNAAEFTDPGGQVEMVVTRQEADAVIRIRDDGVGISPDLLPRVFDLFAQADTSLDRGGGGLGIGLTLVKRVVTLHGGSVEVHSEGPGRGSEFVVRLPAAPGLSDRPPTAAEPAVPASLRMLVVDDNVDMAMSLSILLQMHGHRVEMAHDGSAALELSQAHPFDVVLLDIGLPSMDGYEVARRIRARSGESRPRLVGISGYGFDAHRQRAKDAGFDLYLVKPVDPKLLEALLEQWTQGEGKTPSSPG
jgi:PAS domain S-box-containing protein